MPFPWKEGDLVMAPDVLQVTPVARFYFSPLFPQNYQTVDQYAFSM